MSLNNNKKSFVNSNISEEDSPVVKKQSQDVELTQEQAEEWLHCKNDIKYFLENYVKIQGVGLLDLRGYQHETIDLLNEEDYVMILQGRQSGKSMLMAAYFLWMITFFKDKNIGIVSRSEEQGKDFLASLKYMYESLDFWIKPCTRYYDVKKVVLTNGSKIRVEAPTEKSFRGSTLDIIYLDELAFVNDDIAQKMFTGIQPVIEERNGKFIITSTPNGSEDMFANMWYNATRGDKKYSEGWNGFHTLFVDNDRIPGRDNPEWKAKKIAQIGERKFCIEYLCEFLSDKGTLIDSQILESIKPRSFVYKWRDITFYIDEYELTGRNLCLYSDVGNGVGKDFSTIVIFDYNTLEQVGEFKNNCIGYRSLAMKIIETVEYLFGMGVADIVYSIESNSIGQCVIEVINNNMDKYPDLEDCQFISTHKSHRGVYLSSVTKSKGCQLMKDFIESQRLQISSRDLITELKFFVAQGKQGNNFAAERGKHDDLVMSVVGIMLLLDELSKSDESVYEAMYTTDHVEKGGVTDDDYEDNQEYDGSIVIT